MGGKQCESGGNLEEEWSIKWVESGEKNESKRMLGGGGGGREGRRGGAVATVVCAARNRHLPH